MIQAYKLIRRMKDGRYAPLFCGKTHRYTQGTKYIATLNTTKGFAPRRGFHCTSLPYAPHLSTKNRVWVKLEVSDIELYDRPESQGGTWILAQVMKVIKEISEDEVNLLTKDLK